MPYLSAYYITTEDGFQFQTEIEKLLC